MKLVHAADIHLDSPLRGLERYEGAPVDEIRGATRRAVANLVDLCLVEAASLLLIAGDLYDGYWRDYNTGLFFAKQMARLTREGVGVVWIRGNHDAASEITKSLRLPEGVIELGASRPETRVFEARHSGPRTELPATGCHRRSGGGLPGRETGPLQCGLAAYGTRRARGARCLRSQQRRPAQLVGISTGRWVTFIGERSYVGSLDRISRQSPSPPRP